MRSFVENLEKDKVVLILEWAKTWFGKSKFSNKPIRLFVFRKKKTSMQRHNEYCGTFDYSNSIMQVFLYNIPTTKKLCEVVMHEYKHYLLPEQQFLKHYNKLLNKYDENYLTHPHEKICNRFEKKWGTVCFNELKNKIYK
jgi:hypothetical protein